MISSDRYYLMWLFKCTPYSLAIVRWSILISLLNVGTRYVSNMSIRGCRSDLVIRTQIGTVVHRRHLLMWCGDNRGTRGRS